MDEPPPKPSPSPPSAGAPLHHHHRHCHHHCHHIHHHHCRHHHHHHLHAPSCPLARPVLPSPLLRSHRPFPTSLPSTYAAAPDLLPLGVTVPVVDSRLEIAAGHDTSKNPEHLDEIVDDEEDAEPIFVLTEEWLEFFAKSEAKRRLEKKKKHKKGGG